MKQKTLTRTAYGLAALIALILLIANVYVVRGFAVFGSPLLFATAIIAELILLIILVHSLIRSLQLPLHIAGSILWSAWQGAQSNDYIQKLRTSKSLPKRWLAARLNPNQPTGFILGIGVIIATVLLLDFGRVAHDVVAHGPLTRIDVRVINLMPSIRTPLQTAFFRVVTMAAEFPSVVLLSVLCSSILWYKRQRLAAAFFIAALLPSEGIVLILKYAFGRARPDPGRSLLQGGGFSFPSGHTMRATVMFGLLSYILYRSYRSYTLRISIILGYVISVALVAGSRVYLGVHYPSDVLASIFLGASLLTLLITGIEIITRYSLWHQTVKTFRSKLLGIVPPLMMVCSLLTAPLAIRLTPGVITTAYRYIPRLDQTTLNQLPLHSENTAGKAMEPINFIYIGSEQQIEQLFQRHDWHKADPSTVANTLKAMSVGFQGRQYQSAPVTPSYLNAQPQDLAFQQPTQADTLRQRHHTRLWQTDFLTGNKQHIWVGTASYDEGIEFVGPAKLPTHHIDPNVDAERGYIIRSLGLTRVSYLQAVSPETGKNAEGDVFFTDGKAAVITL